MNPNQPPAGPKDYQAIVLPPLPKPMTQSKYWDEGIDWPLAGERAARMEREDQLRYATAEALRLRDRVAMAEHFFASPESFSNEEFQAVANVVVGCSHYNGKMPYLDEVVRLRDENAALREQVAKVKAFWGLAGSISDELAMAHKCTGMMCYTCAKINTLRSLEEQHG